MKTKITRIALLVAAVFTMGYGRAATTFNGEETNKADSRTAIERSLDQQLNKYLSFPLMEKAEMIGEVTVAFVINAEGRVEVIDCVSANASLRDYVLRKLAKIDVGNNPDGTWKTTYLHLVFKPERA